MPSERDKASGSDGPTVAVIIEAIGKDRTVLELSDRTECPNYGEPRHLDDDMYYAAVTVIQEWEPQDSAVLALVEWLETNTVFLQCIDARKTLEFQSRIFPEQGSESLWLPIDLLRHVVDAGCEIRHQYIRAPTGDELRRYRS